MEISARFLLDTRRARGVCATSLLNTAHLQRGDGAVQDSYRSARRSGGCVVFILALLGACLGAWPVESSAQIAIPPSPTVERCGVRRSSDVEQYTGPPTAYS